MLGNTMNEKNIINGVLLDPYHDTQEGLLVAIKECILLNIRFLVPDILVNQIENGDSTIFGGAYLVAI